MRRGDPTSPWSSTARASCACTIWSWRCTRPPTSSGSRSCSARRVSISGSPRRRRRVMKSAINLATALLVLGSCARRNDPEALRAGDLLVRLRLDRDPPRAGENVLRVDLTDAQGKPLDGAQLGFLYDMPAMGSMPEMKGGGDTKAIGGGSYSITYALPMLGDWTLTLGIDAPGHPHAELRFKVSPPHKGYSVETRGATTPREGGAQTIDLAPERQQLIGVVYARVERRPLKITLRASGRVEVDETRVDDMVLKYDAYVEKLFVDQMGQRVKAGQPLLQLY